ncbi:hypothetical protein Tco_0191021 [Tanacetum coccineum]
MNKRRDFSKSYSSVRRPFANSTTQMANSNAVLDDRHCSVRIPEEKGESRTSSTNSKKEDSSLDSLEDDPKDFKLLDRELEELALKHLGTSLKTNTNLVLPQSHPCPPSLFTPTKQASKSNAYDDLLHESSKIDNKNDSLECSQTNQADHGKCHSKVSQEGEEDGRVYEKEENWFCPYRNDITLRLKGRKKQREARAKRTAHDPITAEDVYDELFKELRDMEVISAEEFKFGEELQTKTPKRMKDDEAKEDEPTKKTGKRRKQMARKGLHTSVDKDDSEDSDEVDEQEESLQSTKTPINPVPVAMKTPSIATYKIIKQGEKGVYQIVREDGTDIVYINFGAMMKSISRDDLTELYRIVMNRYGMNGPEDELERVFWNYL